MDIRVPEVGESIQQALLAKWLKKSGESVKRDETVCEIETDKITLDLHAESDGILHTVIAEGATVAVGTVIGTIDKADSSTQHAEVPGSVHVDAPGQSTSPSVRSRMRQERIDPESVNGSGRGGRITLDDLFSRIESSSRRQQGDESSLDSKPVIDDPLTQEGASGAQRSEPGNGSAAVSAAPGPEKPVTSRNDTREDERRPMSPLRKRVSERLVAVRQQTAMLTTFNEADMSRVMELRGRFRDHYRSLHGVTPGLMPFFIKAVVESLREYPTVNAAIDGDDIVFHHYFDIGIAVSAEKGLIVPVLRNADRMKFFEIDLAIAEFREKAATNRLAISDLTGGTFTITNGGVFGSMLSTPILNPPQSAVLGMHAIQERPVARAGQVVIRPMMYLALSYDHRLIDGREAVSFLKRVKELVEEPEELLLEA